MPLDEKKGVFIFDDRKERADLVALYDQVRKEVAEARAGEAFQQAAAEQPPVAAKVF